MTDGGRSLTADSPPTSGAADGVRRRTRTGRSHAGRPAVGVAPALAVAACLLVAVNLRPAVVAVSPLLPVIRHDTGMGAPLAGLLTTLPVLCFGAAAPLAPRLARRVGIEPAVGVALLVLAVGTMARLVAGSLWLFLGTFLAGAGIAVANVLVPALVRRDFARVGLMTGLYAAGLNLGAAAAAALTVPLHDAAHIGWRPALAVWAVPVVAAAVLWTPVVRHRGPLPQRPPTVSLRRSRTAWLVTGFIGLQSCEFYAAAAWLPTIFSAHGISRDTAGLMLAWANVIGMAGAVTLPVLAGRRGGEPATVLAVVALYATGLTGLLLAPAGGAWLWMTLFGIAQGGGFAVALRFVAVRSASVHGAAALSAMAQGFGYLLASLGPVTLGATHTLTGGWSLAIALLLALLVPMLWFGLRLSAERRPADPLEKTTRV